MTRALAKALGAASVALLCAKSAPAELSDGAYGRFDGDTDLSVSAFAGTRDGAGWIVGASARALYLSTAGPYALFDAAPSGDRDRALGIGMTLRPLFLPRWGSDLERGPAWLDLSLDSIAVDLGARWDLYPDRPRAPGAELGLSFEVPLAGRAIGPFVGMRGALQWPKADGRAIATGTLSVSWHFTVDAHLADAGDTVLR
jgi:hypothetical protein